MGTILAAQITRCTFLSPAYRKLIIFTVTKAAKFGRGFLDFYNPTDFIHMGQTLRVLNAVRFYEIGIPISYSQLVVPFLSFSQFPTN